MVFLVSDEVKAKNGGPRMIVTGYSSGMVECRWYDGHVVKREPFGKMNWFPVKDKSFAKRHSIKTPGMSGRFSSYSFLPLAIA